jgi:flagellar biosynthesis anti-sigma factor FlgM
MSIDFRNPLANQSALLARLRTMISRAGSPSDSTALTEGSADRKHTDRVSLSSEAQRIAREPQHGESVAHNDAARIAALKQAIETGTFRIDSDRIADKVNLHYGSR